MTDRTFWKDMGKVALASLVMAAAAWGTLRGVSGLLSGTVGKLFTVAAPTLVGVVVYFAMALLLKLPELQLILNKVKERGER